jgi:outer membrane protein OmpA-like peptidoglycan-associated protein
MAMMRTRFLLLSFPLLSRALPLCPTAIVILAAALLVAPGAHAKGRPAASASAPSGKTASPLRVLVDKSKVDLKEHRLELKMSREAGKVSLVVTGESGATLAEEEQDFSGRPAGSPLIVSWTPSSDEAVARIELRATDAFGYYAGVALSPWFVAIPHEDVVFRTHSADIDDPEKPKLEQAFTRLGEILAKDKDREHRTLTLFIAGHTDTVGSDSHNLKLSQARARSIAGWFRKRGVRVPIAYEGFGESAPAVKTADQVDEPRNRRVDYILSDDEPSMKTTGFRPAWKRIN